MSDNWDWPLSSHMQVYHKHRQQFPSLPKSTTLQTKPSVLGLWRRNKVQPRGLFKLCYYHSNDCRPEQCMAQITYRQQHNTVIDYIPGTDCRGRKSRHFSPLLPVSLGKRVCSVRKASGSHIPHENRKSTDTIMETRAKEESQIVNKAVRKL